ncbi:MAG: TIR domain-containing protein [Anaerolineae bacterium]|jgi:hypothetical protein|nr:TIR domain-containing protein [Anaerolineae bacterium]
MSNHIFIAYSPRDQKLMLTLREALLRAGFRPWIDPAPRPGQDWREEIDVAIRAADMVLVLITPNSAASPYVTYEWAMAMGQSIPVYPVICRPAPLHPRLHTLLTFDMGAWKDERQFWEYLSRELRRLIPPTGPLVAPPPVAPPTAASAPAPLPWEYSRAIMPAQPGAWLVIRRGPGLHTMFRLEKAVIVLGRDAANDITISDPEISRHHLRLSQHSSGYAVEDLGSTNGTLINGQRVSGVVPLLPGSALSLGDTILLSYEVVPGG